MKVFVLVKSPNNKKIDAISAISEDRTKKFHAEIGESPHRIFMLKAFEDFEKLCTQECGLKDKTDEVDVINYVRSLSGDLFDFDTFMLGRDWCTAKADDGAGTKFLADLQEE